MPAPDALTFLASQPTFHLAGVDADGQPVLRTLNGVVVGGRLVFHASPKGEKTTLLGRPVVVSEEETVADIPSTFTDPERACPATTLYRSVQAHGVLEALENRDEKAAALQALMEKLQPGGGHVPITADHPYYRAEVRGLLLAGVKLDQVTGKAKLLQNRNAADQRTVLEALWRRGAAGDARAIELIRHANPATPAPAFLSAPEGVTLRAWLGPEHVEAACALLQGTYWNDRFSAAELRRAHQESVAWVGATDAQGHLVATARAISDGAKYAWVYDVCVAEAWRGRGLGKAVTRLVLDHPRVRDARFVLLGTKDAQGLYAGLGFVPRASLPPRPYPSTEMVLTRASRG